MRMQRPAALDAAHRHIGGGEKARRHAARVLAEGEQHDVLDDDAERDRRHEPGVRAALHERAHGDALDRHAPERAQQQRSGDRQRERPSERDPEREAQHGTQHHGAALREVYRVGNRIGDVEAEREEPVHAAEPDAGDESRIGKHAGGCFAEAMRRRRLSREPPPCVP